MAEPPGTPLVEHVTDIAARLKEIEAERAKEHQAASLPEPAEVIFKEIWR